MTQINLNIPENWSDRTASLIAAQFGYVFNERFVSAVMEYRQAAETAVVKDYISLLGERHLRQYTPPLEKAARR